MAEAEIYIGTVSFDEALYIMKYKVNRYLEKVSQLYEVIDLAQKDCSSPFGDDEKTTLNRFEDLKSLCSEIRSDSYDIKELSKELLLEYKNTHPDISEEE